MNENKKTLSFEASYTLDVIVLLDLLFSGEMGQDVELIRYWEEQLGEDTEIILNKARKILPKGESLASTLIPLIAADKEFNELRLLELLQSPKYLVAQLKKQGVGKDISKSYKTFLSKDLEKLIGYLSLIITQLERAKFKTFWLEKCLPLINAKIKVYYKETGHLNVIETINQFLFPQSIEKRLVYVVSFQLFDLKSIQLFNNDVVVSINFSTKHMIECQIEQLLCPISIHKQLKARVRMLRHDQVIQRTFKQVKHDYKDLGNYLEDNVKLAYQTYINEQLGICNQPYDYLGRYQLGTYKISTLFYQYMKINPRQDSQLVANYLIEIVEQVELDNFDQRFITLMSRVL